MTLGEKIRKLRLERKMTLQDVAEQTGYSKALISRIENDSVSPSIVSLVKIASALQISLHQLFAAVDGGQRAVVKKSKRTSRAISGGNVTVENMGVDAADGKMTAVLMTFEPGASTGKSAKLHSGEEWWHILKGKLRGSVGDRTYDLAEGDSIYLHSSIPHKWRNLSKGKTSAVVVVTPL